MLLTSFVLQVASVTWFHVPGALTRLASMNAYRPVHKHCLQELCVIQVTRAARRHRGRHELQADESLYTALAADLQGMEKELRVFDLLCCKAMKQNEP